MRPARPTQSDESAGAETDQKTPAARHTRTSRDRAPADQPAPAPDGPPTWTYQA